MLGNDKKTIQNLVVIVARKSDYLRCLLASLGRDLERLRSHEERVFRHKLAEVIASLQPQLFASREEIERGTLSLGTQLEDLDLEVLWTELSRGLA